jgi:HK97 family phage major capsid protein
VVATPRSLACIVRISRELLADGVDIDRAIRTAIGQAFAKELDRVGLRGSGTAPEPRGLLNTSGVNSVSQGTDGAALASYAPILAGVQAILDDDGPMPTAAIMAPRGLVDFGGLVDTTDQPLRAPQLVQPIRFIGTSQVPVNLTVGTSTDCSEIYLGDFSRMYFLLRENLSVQLLREAYAKTGELGFLCHLRADVVVPYPKVFAIVKGVRKAA